MDDADRAVLEFEQTWPTRHGDKASTIRAELGLSPVAYFRAIERLRDDDEAAAEFPLLVRRLRATARARAARRRLASGR